MGEVIALNRKTLAERREIARVWRELFEEIPPESLDAAITDVRTRWVEQKEAAGWKRETG